MKFFATTLAVLSFVASATAGSVTEDDLHAVMAKVEALSATVDEQSATVGEQSAKIASLEKLSAEQSAEIASLKIKNKIPTDTDSQINTNYVRRGLAEDAQGALLAELADLVGSVVAEQKASSEKPSPDSVWTCSWSDEVDLWGGSSKPATTAAPPGWWTGRSSKAAKSAKAGWNDPLDTLVHKIDNLAADVKALQADTEALQSCVEYTSNDGGKCLIGGNDIKTTNVRASTHAYVGTGDLGTNVTQSGTKSGIKFTNGVAKLFSTNLLELTAAGLLELTTTDTDANITLATTGTDANIELKTDGTGAFINLTTHGDDAPIALLTDGDGDGATIALESLGDRTENQQPSIELRTASDNAIILLTTNGEAARIDLQTFGKRAEIRSITDSADISLTTNAPFFQAPDDQAGNIELKTFGGNGDILFSTNDFDAPKEAGDIVLSPGIGGDANCVDTGFIAGTCSI